jgi:magnesium transporter
MIRLKYHAPGTPPATLATPGGTPGGPASITLIQYDQEGILESQIDSFEELERRLDPSKVNWINVDGLGDIALCQKLAKRFNIHPLSMEDVLNTTQRPKVEQFEEHIFIISEMIYIARDGRVTVEQLSLFLGKDYVLTLQEEDGHDVFEHVRSRLRNGRGYSRKMGPDYLAYALLDATVDQFFPILEGVGDSVEDVETELLEKPSRETLRRLYDDKRLLLQLRRAAWPQREIFSSLVREESPLITKETRVFLRDCYDHSTQIIDIIESYRDLAAGLMDVYLSSLGFRTNEIMRILTIVSVFFIPLTFLAGVYGMNFDTAFPLNMPELRFPFGYLSFWAVCLTVVVLMFAFFKRKKWL